MNAALKLLAATACAALLAGCVTSPITKATGYPVAQSHIYDQRIQRPRPGDASVTFYRDMGYRGSAGTFAIWIDGVHAFDIRHRRYDTVYLAPGEHTFHLTCAGFLCGGVNRVATRVLIAGGTYAYRIKTAFNTISLIRIQ